MTVRVYTGSGTSRTGSPLLVEELSRHLRVPVAGIDEREMRGSHAWESETTTLVFAGQSVGQFKAALGEEVMDRIRRGIHSGAFDYIGICAGVAFASSHIKYRMKPVNPQHPDIKIENTGLSIYYGLATGPCRSISPLPFSGESDNLFLSNLHSMSDLKSYNAFFWGGPAIIPMKAPVHQDRRILAVLAKDGTPLAAQSKFGDGKVSLFSFHPEINENNVGRWAQARYLSHTEAYRLETLAKQLDGTAFARFLTDTGLAQHLAHERKAAFAAPRYNLHLL